MSEPTVVNQDEEHLRLLTIFHYVVGGLMAFFSCIPLIHVAVGLMLIFGSQHFDKGKDAPPAWFGWLFVTLGGSFVLFGWTLSALVACAGRSLARRRRYTFCLVVAGAACLFMPFGTVLGVFTIIVLIRPSVKALFAQTAKTT